eukprot:Gb_03412 [translate_table: standard]
MKKQAGLVEEENGASSEESSEGGANKKTMRLTDYERQRLHRIEENKAKILALGLPTLASSLPQYSKNKKLRTASRKTLGKAQSKHDDNEYQPSTEDEQSNSSSDQIEDIEDKVQIPKKGTPGRRRSVGRPKGKKMKSLNSLTTDKSSKEHDSAPVDNELDDDFALQQALALSMGVSMEDAAAIAAASKEDSDLGRSKAKGKAKDEVDEVPRGKRQRRQTKNINTMQLSEDEVIAFFFFFDETGKGKITVRDLERVARLHDFTWSKQEITDMISIFDKDQDGQLSLDDFQTIVGRCNMIGGS